MLKPVLPEIGDVAKRIPTELTVQQPDPGRIAVLLNRNARKVNDRVAKQLEHIVGKDHVFQTHNLEEAESFSREVVQRGYGTVVSGGGDGTLSRIANLVHRYVRDANDWRIERFHRYGETQPLLKNPRFAFLRLGTGNGMSNIVGSGKPSHDLQKIVDYVPGRTQTIPLIELDGERFFFGGCGYDSQILDDYNQLKARAKNILFKLLMQNVTGYLMAIFGRTIPRLVTGTGEKMEARVVNQGRAFYVDPRRGDYVLEVQPGATLFEGRARIVSAGTTPFFGYGFKVFPFARMMPGMMHLRIATLGPLRLVPWHIRSVWKGTYRHPTGILDFLVEKVAIELDRPFPYQHSGDAQGLRDRLDFQIAPEGLELVDLYRPRRMS
jgi:diacylglycerol kinase family enzyme